MHSCKIIFVGPAQIIHNEQTLTLVENVPHHDSQANNETMLQTRARLSKNARMVEYRYHSLVNRRRRDITAGLETPEEDSNEIALMSDLLDEAYDDLTKFEVKYYLYFLDGDGVYIDDGDKRLNDDNFNGTTELHLLARL